MGARLGYRSRNKRVCQCWRPCLVRRFRQCRRQLAECYPHAGLATHANADAFSHNNAYTYSDTDLNANTFTQGYSDSETRPNTEAASYSAALTRGLLGYEGAG